jgi:CBS domain containing-hemolysin-like protein
MLAIVVEVLLGGLVVLVITALTGYFVAQEFGYVAVDRSALRARANGGDRAARRALGITGSTSFMLSGAQLGITVTGLVIGYIAEPLIGEGIGELLGAADIPTSVGVAVGTVAALLFATAVQMVFGELFPKNLAIARPETVARRLAMSTAIYLKLFGWLITVFDAASNRLLRALRIEPVHDVEHAATARDLEAIIEESRDSGSLPEDLSRLLDRVLDFSQRTARSAMIPRPRVSTVAADQPLSGLLLQMATGHSRYPVIGESVDDVVGVVDLRDLLALSTAELVARRARDLARPPLFVPDSLTLPSALDQLRAGESELACVLDEYGGFAGVITIEDIAEELVGEITDEHDPADLEEEPQPGQDSWTVAGSMTVEDAERLLDHELPRGKFTTIAGMVMSRLGRVPEPGDTVTMNLPDATETDAADRVLAVTVHEVDHHVPARLELRWLTAEDDPSGLRGRAPVEQVWP